MAELDNVVEKLLREVLDDCHGREARGRELEAEARCSEGEEEGCKKAKASVTRLHEAWETTLKNLTCCCSGT